MSQRVSGYERKERDLYETPEWVTRVLVPHIPRRITDIWEPACASCKMVRALQEAGYEVYATDISGSPSINFLAYSEVPRRTQAIVTNPPYELAQQFINQALTLTYPHGFVAMLLRTDFDHAKSRQHLFANHKAFAKKIVLTKRIKWFEDSKGQPSFNHAWFIWDHENLEAPVLAYSR